MQPGQKCQRELEELLNSRYPLIFFRSAEESRAINCIIAAFKAIANRVDNREGKIFEWKYTKGFGKYVFEGPERRVWQDICPNSAQKTNTIEQALSFLNEQLEAQVSNYCSPILHTYVLPDWSAFIKADSYAEARTLKELVISILQRASKPKMTLIILGQDWLIPAILRNFVHILDLPLPTKEELYEELFKYTLNDQDITITDKQAQYLSEQAQGMTLQAANQVTRLINIRRLWTEPEEAKQLLLEEKKQEIEKIGVLKYYEPQGQGLEDVGGLLALKAWIRERQPFFLQNSYPPKLRPRAILLEGYPGCGKSFIARAIAQEWGLPLINFEISRLQSKYVGESESNTYQALRAIEASAPNILFMDEIEKAFSGVGGDSTGVSTRQFGTFLSWLNDHKYPIFFIATSNNRSKLPPELFRAGRFDEMFIIMPPSKNEREDIITKKVADYLPSSDIFDSNLKYLVENTAGFSGAELEKLVKEIAYLFYSSPTPNILQEADLQKVLDQIKPQYHTKEMKELLRKYKKMLDDGEVKSASTQQPDYLEDIN